MESPAHKQKCHILKYCSETSAKPKNHEIASFKKAIGFVSQKVGATRLNI